MSKPIQFATYGPYDVGDLSDKGFLDEISESKKGLLDAMGVYIIAAEDDMKNLVPWYVGRTDNSFKKRLEQHFDSGKFHLWLSKSGSLKLKLILIARINESNTFKRFTAEEAKRTGLMSIRRLEWSLIGSCLLKNPSLLNKQGRSFYSLLQVPGYWNSPPIEPGTGAQSLSKMLRTVR